MGDKDSNVIKTYGWQEPKCDQVLVWLMVDKDLGPKMQRLMAGQNQKPSKSWHVVDWDTRVTKN